MTNNTLTQARRIADELAMLAKDEYDADDARPDGVSACLRSASYKVEDAIREMLAIAAAERGLEIVPGSERVLRNREVVGV